MCIRDRDKRGRKKKNFSAFIVDKGAPGFSFGTKEKKMGIRGSVSYTHLDVYKRQDLLITGSLKSYIMFVENFSTIG